MNGVIPFLGEGLDINSWHFLFFSILAIGAARLFKPNIVRHLALLLFNSYFILHFIKDGTSLLFLLTALAAIYITARVRIKARADRIDAIQLGSIIAIWGALFLVKDPSLAGAVNPFAIHPVQIIGLSYLMFRGISYIMECNSREDTNILWYLNYMLYFPMLLAGPIERFQAFKPQCSTILPFGPSFIPAAHRITNGLIKKYILAEYLSHFGILSTSKLPDTTPELLWIGALLQLFIIYLDFSGYCDIVIGTSQLLGFRIRENFNKPFLSKNIQEFWERWHISLGQLLRDYVFNPSIKFSIKRTKAKYHFYVFVSTYFVTMLLVAFWHGTTLGFLIFGLTHATALVLYQLKEQIRRRRRKQPNADGGLIALIKINAARAATYSFVSTSLLLWIISEDASSNIAARMLGIK